MRLLALLALPIVTMGTEPADPQPPAEGGAMGRFAGTVTVGPELQARRIRFHLYPEVAAPPPARRDDSVAAETRNVVVYLEAGPGTPRRPAAPGPAQVMRQQGMAFEPHVLVIQAGSTVEFPNADPIFHNVFSLSKAATFDLGRYPSGASRSVRFDRPGLVKVFCHIHSDMSAVILVLDHPYFAIPDTDGRYRIDGVPPGDYRVTAWHERARPLSRKVRSESGRVSRVDFSIPLTEPAGGD